MEYPVLLYQLWPWLLVTSWYFYGILHSIKGNGPGSGPFEKLADLEQAAKLLKELQLYRDFNPEGSTDHEIYQTFGVSWLGNFLVDLATVLAFLIFFPSRKAMIKHGFEVSWVNILGIFGVNVFWDGVGIDMCRI